MKTVTKEFRLTRSLKALFCALVRPAFDDVGIGSVIRNLHSVVYRQQTERVRRRFLSLAGFKPGIDLRRVP